LALLWPGPRPAPGRGRPVRVRLAAGRGPGDHSRPVRSRRWDVPGRPASSSPRCCSRHTAAPLNDHVRRPARAAVDPTMW